MTAPFERLRTMMMADWSNKTLLGTARKMWASGGFFGLWRGNLVSVIKVVPQSAIQYAVRVPTLLLPLWLAWEVKLLQSADRTARIVPLLGFYHLVVRQTQTNQQHISDMLRQGLDLRFPCWQGHGILSSKVLKRLGVSSQAALSHAQRLKAGCIVGGVRMHSGMPAADAAQNHLGI